MKVKTYVTMEYHELEQFINDYYGVNDVYSITEAQELGNDSSWTCEGITKKEYEKESTGGMKEWFLKCFYKNEYVPVADLMKRGVCPMYNTRDILLELVQHDIIPEGDYLIEVSW